MSIIFHWGRLFSVNFGALGDIRLWAIADATSRYGSTCSGEYNGPVPNRKSINHPLSYYNYIWMNNAGASTLLYPSSNITLLSPSRGHYSSSLSPGGSAYMDTTRDAEPEPPVINEEPREDVHDLPDLGDRVSVPTSSRGDTRSKAIHSDYTFPGPHRQRQDTPLSTIATAAPGLGFEMPAAGEGVLVGIRYAFDVIQIALRLLQKPLGIVLFLWLLAIIILVISSTLRTALMPLCWLPGMSSSLLCRSLSQNPPIQLADYPRLIEAQTATFEQLLGEAAGGSALSLEVKKAQLATKELLALVRISTLKSKTTLAQALVDFINDARKTGRRLQRLHAKIGASLDIVVAFNEYAFRTIEATNCEKKKSTSLDLFTSRSQPHESQLVASTFMSTIDSLSAQVSCLIGEAEENLVNLNDLEERLDALNEVVIGDTKVVSADREEILASLWTLLGGNRKELVIFNENLSLLKNIGSYRKQAQVHVVAALQTLQSLSYDMEELKGTIAIPGENIPLYVQMKSIQLGLERLREIRLNSRGAEDAVVRGVVETDLGEYDH